MIKIFIIFSFLCFHYLNLIEGNLKNVYYLYRLKNIKESIRLYLLNPIILKNQI